MVKTGRYLTEEKVWLGQFFRTYRGVEAPGVQRHVSNFIVLATDSHQRSSRELSFSHRRTF